LFGQANSFLCDLIEAEIGGKIKGSAILLNMSEIAKFKTRFDRSLGRFLDRKRREMRRLTSDKYILEIVDHAKRLVMGGGKRIRPYLAWMSYREAGGKDSHVIETLVGLELFHAFALVHDDIMDRGLERHGVPTTHRLYGDGQAILLGDLLFNWSYELIAPTKGREIFSKMVDEVIVGQMLDVDATRRKKVSDQFIEDKMRLKTASYSFVRPLQFGAALAGKSKLFSKLEKFGLPLGLAFQIQDDLLDITTSSTQLGKSAFNDVKEGQKTAFTQYASRRGFDLSRYKNKILTVQDKKKIREIFWNSGAIEYGKGLMEKYFMQAEKAAEGKVLFLNMVAYIRSRSH
jgi:geranylgeranyl diphosphate synthase type I